MPPQVWVDSPFMHGIFSNRMVRMGGSTRDARTWALDESLRLYRVMTDALADPDTGLYRHAYIDLGWVSDVLPTVLPVEATFWARGNGWVFYYLADLLETMQSDGGRTGPIMAPPA